MSTENVDTEIVNEENKEVKDHDMEPKHDHGGHDHDHDHDHDHEHGEDEKKSGKSEKKVRKALQKLGMNKMEGVNRVTIKQKDNYILVVKDPEVYSSKDAENTFIIFGEISMDDDKLGKQEVDKIKQENEIKIKQDETEKKENIEIVPDNDDQDVSEEGLDPTNIDMVINEAKCTRQKAVKALRKCDNDVVAAILELNSY